MFIILECVLSYSQACLYQDLKKKKKKKKEGGGKKKKKSRRKVIRNVYIISGRV